MNHHCNIQNNWKIYPKITHTYQVKLRIRKTNLRSAKDDTNLNLYEFINDKLLYK